QNTAWTNVEKALENLTTNEIITADDIIKTDSVHLGQIIRSSGYYNSKAKKLKELAGWWNLFVTTGKIIDFSDDKLRSELLNIWGVGKETADSIACYAFGRPVFVVDAYTKRILVRLQGLDSNPAYDEIQKGVYDSLPRDSMLYNHLHGLLVILGKEHCKARITECLTCPLVATCTSGIMKQTDNKKTRRNENPGSTN
ncbi:MAG: hypothetical protein RAP03_14180, partial [Candidatus Electryonea clarkiae]|nr:hypothetical protein [Candidatus Electryonea clarkiae]